MGLAASSGADDQYEQPSDKHQATLYYFAGRGLADQIRWMLAAGEISFTQKIISQRSQLLKMSTRQLPFGQLPLLQIDGIEIVQSQAAIRYLAKRGGLQGKSEEELLKCDMIAEAVRDLLGYVTEAPFKRVKARRLRQQSRLQQQESSVPPSSSSAPSNGSSTSNHSSNKPTNTNQSSTNSADSSPIVTALPTEALPAPVPAIAPSNDVWEAHLKAMKEKWDFVGTRFEAIIRTNHRANSVTATSPTSSSTNKPSTNPASSGSTVQGTVYDPDGEYYLVGTQLTYADILVAHITTWFVEECGIEIVSNMPFLVHLQNQVISLPGIKQFIKSVHYFALDQEAFVEQTSKVLGKNLLN